MEESDLHHLNELGGIDGHLLTTFNNATWIWSLFHDQYHSLPLAIHEHSSWHVRFKRSFYNIHWTRNMIGIECHQNNCKALQEKIMDGNNNCLRVPLHPPTITIYPPYIYTGIYMMAICILYIPSTISYHICHVTSDIMSMPVQTCRSFRVKPCT